MDCPFCPKLKRLTRWYLHDTVSQVVACEDLHPRKYKYRILVVGWGPQWHREWQAYTPEEQAILEELARAMARYDIRLGRAKRLVEIDIECSSSHGYCQACMR